MTVSHMLFVPYRHSDVVKGEKFTYLVDINLFLDGSQSKYLPEDHQVQELST